MNVIDFFVFLFEVFLVVIIDKAIAGKKSYGFKYSVLNGC